MSEYNPSLVAGQTLRRLIQERYSSQEEFAYDFGADLRTISRYVNGGINKVKTIQEFAEFFDVDFVAFFEEPDL